MEDGALSLDVRMVGERICSYPPLVRIEDSCLAVPPLEVLVRLGSWFHPLD